MLLFIYKGSYPNTDVAAEGVGGQFKAITDKFKTEAEVGSGDWHIRAKLHATMYSIAEKYIISGLHEYSGRRFMVAFDTESEFDKISIHGKVMKREPHNHRHWTSQMKFRCQIQMSRLQKIIGLRRPKS